MQAVLMNFIYSVFYVVFIFFNNMLSIVSYKLIILLCMFWRCIFCETHNIMKYLNLAITGISLSQYQLLEYVKDICNLSLPRHFWNTHLKPSPKAPSLLYRLSIFHNFFCILRCVFPCILYPDI